MDDVVYEEFKGTGNMELVLDRKLSEKRVFPAIDIPKSGTRRDDLLLTLPEQEAVDTVRKALNGMRADEAVENILNMFSRTSNNNEFIQLVKKTKIIQTRCKVCDMLIKLFNSKQDKIAVGNREIL